MNDVTMAKASPVMRLLYVICARWPWTTYLIVPPLLLVAICVIGVIWVRERLGWPSREEGSDA
jgi:hypothetical protein